jgi:dihydroflavonol-4-reductase
MSKTVLVTGGSGFIGGWTVVELLRRGYTVRTTVRSLKKEPAIRAEIAAAVDPGDRLSFFAADLGADDGWDAAVAGCDYVLHVAAPVGVDAPRDPDELIIPTRDGALRVLRAACRAGVKRVVLTSAIEACRRPTNSPDGVSDETVWTNVKERGLGPYRVAKTLAERAAWDFIASQPGTTQLTTVLPSAVLGPVLGKSQAGSVHLVKRILTGGMPRYPRFGFCVVDVRDVADAHIRAMEAPEAAGQRFITAGEFMMLGDVAQMLRAELGPAAKKAPTRPMPDVVVRLMARFQPAIRFIVPLLGRRHVFSSAKAKTMLGWEARPAKATIIEAAKSAMAIGEV